MSRSNRSRLTTVLLWFHGLSVLGWTVMLPISLYTGLRRSLPYIVFLSVWALWVGSAAAYAGMLAARRAEEAA